MFENLKPQPADKILALMQMYREAFQLNNGGYASAIAMVLFGIIVIVSVLQFQLLRIGARK